MPDVLRVLVIDDSPAEAKRLRDKFARAGRRALIDRVDGERGLARAFAGERWDVVVANAGAAHIDGARALRLTREHDRCFPFVVTFTSTLAGQDLQQLPHLIERTVTAARERKLVVSGAATVDYASAAP